jgi:hypothetical protein
MIGVREGRLGVAITLAGAMIAGGVALAETVAGEVVAVTQSVQTANEGEVQEITLHTRQGENLRLRLGRAGWCDECIRVGERVRAQTMARAGSESNAPLRVRQLVNESRGTKLRIRSRQGQLLDAVDGDRDRARRRDGSCGGGPCAGAGGGPVYRGGRGRGGGGNPGGGRGTR